MEKRILFHLGYINLEYAIRKDEPIIIDTSTLAERQLHDHWGPSNCLSVIFYTKISAGFRSSVYQHNNVRALLKAIDEQFETSDKALASTTLIMKFSSLRLTNIRGV